MVCARTYSHSNGHLTECNCLANKTPINLSILLLPLFCHLRAILAQLCIVLYSLYHVQVVNRKHGTTNTAAKKLETIDPHPVTCSHTLQIIPASIWHTYSTYRVKLTHYCA